MTRKSAFTLNEMIELWKSEKTHKQKGRNDRIEKNRGGISYYLFGNEIAFFDPVKEVLEVSDCKWRSVTTKDRLNTLGIAVSQMNFTWYIGGKEWEGNYTITLSEIRKQEEDFQKRLSELKTSYDEMRCDA